jgi:hypothetical protein
VANVDGDVKIRVSLDDKGVEKGADRVKKKMQGLARTATKAFSVTARRKDIEQSIAGYREQARVIEETMRMEKRMLSELMRIREKIEYDPKVREKADQMGIVDLDAAIAASNTRITAAQKTMDGYNAKIREGNSAIREMETNSDSTGAAIKKLGDRMNQLARRIFIFNVMRRALLAMQEGLTNLLKQDSAVAKSMAQIKGSLYAAFMPIYNYILPAIRTLLNFLAQLASAIASIVGSLFGVSAAALENASALNQQAGATGNAGGAAKKAAKSIAAFDEINQLSETPDGGGGGGAGGAGGWDFSGLDGVSERMRTIAKLVLAIGAGIAAWRLAKALGGLKDASIMRNLAFITGAAITIWSVLDLIVPAIKDIIDGGPDIENVLRLIGGIAIALGGISFMMGNVGGGLVWLAIGAAALIAANWDTVTQELQKWDDKISDLVKDYPVLEAAYEGFKKLVTEIVDGFREIAGIIVKLATEPMSIDILGDIGDMSFTSTLTAAVITSKLLTTIGKLFGMKGSIGIGKTGAVLLTLTTAIDLATDVIDIIQGNVEDKGAAIRELIIKALFGAAAAVITVATGGGAFALMLTVPIGIKIGAKVAEIVEEKTGASAEGMYATEIQDAIRAAETLEELKAVVESFTGLQIKNDVFAKLVGPDLAPELLKTTLGLVEAKKQAEAFAGVFYQQSGTEGFGEWLKSLGLIEEQVNGAQKPLDEWIESMGNLEEQTGISQERLEEFAEKYKIWDEQRRAAAAATNESQFSEEGMQNVSDAAAEAATAIGDAAEGAVSLQTDLASVETALAGVETAAGSMATVLADDMATAYEDMKTGAEETGSAMSGTFALAAARIRTYMGNSVRGVFKSFSSGGAVFKGIENGIAAAFKHIVNGLIDGMNAVLSKSFDKINDALDKIRNTQINGTKPFIGIPRVTFSRIPRLAQGAVIPANREFLAILGDQNQGTNIEAPLDTIVEAVMIAMTRAGMDGGNIAAAVKSALNGMAFKVGKDEIGYVVADAINGNRRREGKLALNL